MLNSNRSLGANAYTGTNPMRDTVSANISTLDNIKMRRQMQSVHNNGGQNIRQVASDNVRRAAVRPLIRKATARDYAND